jgi:hypothetical protein
MNIYNRCFDDQSQLRIRLETAAIEGIFELVETQAFELAWSFMLDYENSLNPHEDRKEWAELLCDFVRVELCQRLEFLRWREGLLKVLRSSREMPCISPVPKLGGVIISSVVMTLSFGPCIRGGGVPS